MQKLISNENLNIINRRREIKEEIIYNFCDEDCGAIPFRVINKIYELGISIFSLKRMNIEEFGSLYGVKKVDTLNDIQSNYEKAIDKSYSIYSLLAFGLSNVILNQLLSNGFKRLYEVFFTTREELINKYNISNSSTDKILNIIENCEYNIEDFTRYDDFKEFSSIRIKNADYQKAFKNIILEILSIFDFPVSISYLKRQIPHNFELLNL